MKRGTNALDTGSHFYEVYETADGKYVTIGAIEPKFYAALLTATGLDGADLPDQMDASRWPEMKTRMRTLFLTQTRAEWMERFEGVEACFAPVLSLLEAPSHPHNQARNTFIEVGGLAQPAPAPRFSRTAGAVHGPPAHPGEHTESVLSAFGFDTDEIAALKASGAVASL